MLARLAFDEGAGIGLGHRRRMEALAGVLTEGGWTVELVSAERGAQADVVVVDSYRWRADDRERFSAQVVVAMDDLDRDLAVDLLILPRPSDSVGSPDFLSAHRVLAGVEFALLAPMTVTPRPIGEMAADVLVTMGGADHAGLGASAAAAVASALPDAMVRLVLGPYGSADVPTGVVGVCMPAGLSDALADTDLVVTAGGVTLLESLRAGRPTIAVVTAQNQRRAVEAMRAAGAVVVALHERIGPAAVTLARDASTRQRLSARGAALVDGAGARRVAHAIEDLWWGSERCAPGVGSSETRP